MGREERDKGKGGKKKKGKKRGKGRGPQFPFRVTPLSAVSACCYLHRVSDLKCIRQARLSCVYLAALIYHPTCHTAPDMYYTTGLLSSRISSFFSSQLSSLGDRDGCLRSSVYGRRLSTDINQMCRSE